MQRHHLLPCQVMKRPVFAKLVDAIGGDRIGFDDFRRNGLLLPSTEDRARRTLLPLHRGPHRIYNEAVASRIGQREADWQARRRRSDLSASLTALMRPNLLQKALRRRLLAPDRKPVCLNLRDPLASGLDFSELDALADSLWAATEPISGREG